MPRYTLSTILAVAATATSVVAQGATNTYTSGTPLASKHFSYPDGIPYQADPDDGVRGTEYGYNLCNSTTEGPTSLCQTGFLNHVDDFCLWGPPTPNTTISDSEQEEVAWCTKPGRGTRIIPAGAIQGLQFMQTPDYVQVVGFIDQTLINIQAGDYGGELDPHGADGRGNPLGGLMYSNAFPSNNGNNNTFQQVIEWANFVGSDFFCFKACDPAGPHPADYCQHIYDLIGCSYNMPNNAQNGTFEACQGDSQLYPGVYVENGVTMTYSQPPESLGPITTMPYTPVVPASSNCVTFQSSALFSALPTASSSGGVSPSGSGSSTGTSKPASQTGSTSRSGTSSAPSATGSSAASALGSSSSTAAVSLLGAIFAMVFLA